MYRARRIAVVGITGALVALLVISMSGSGPVATSSTPPPGPHLVVALTAATTVTVPGVPPAVPWPQTGQGAVGVPAAGLMQTSPAPEEPVPIASVTKIMTAYVVLLDHPIGLDAQGPRVRMTMADQLDFDHDSGADDSNVPVIAGEYLTERQMLEGLLVHSADNLADTLAVWDAGSIPAFVTKMNARAAALGMSSTHYADASGLDPRSESTASDILVLSEHAMALPAFAAIVDEPSVVLPFAGRVWNYVSSIGTNGIIGIKSGFTQAAMGNLVLAAVRRIDGHDVTIFAVALHQLTWDPLTLADREDQAMIAAVARGLVAFPVVGDGAVVGRLGSEVAGRSRRGGAGAPTVPVVAAAPLVVLAWPGEQISLRPDATRSDPAVTAVDAGDVVGSLSALSPAGQARVELVAARALKV